LARTIFLLHHYMDLIPIFTYLVFTKNCHYEDKIRMRKWTAILYHFNFDEY